MLKIMLVVGARPNFMKVAPLIREIRRRRTMKYTLVHTGQHYDKNMSDDFFTDLGMPFPDINLNVGSGSHAAQTAMIMERFEPVLLKNKPDCLVVVGDINSTMACAIVAVKLGVPTAHVEAGLRSFDREMPEEINRIITDSICNYLFTTEKSGNENLLKEGVSPDRIHFVGNSMIDSLVYCLENALTRPLPDALGATEGKFAVLTLHRPSNVDDRDTFARLLGLLNTLSERLPMVFPVHPRTRQRMESFGLDAGPNVHLINPLGYLDFIGLVARASMVVTDSGGIQEETAYLGVPCLTLRENTERPVTMDCGTNRLTGTSPEVITEAFEAVLDGISEYSRPELWDGASAGRILNVLERAFRD